MKTLRIWGAIFALGTGMVVHGLAAVELPSIMGSKMVLQRESHAPVWGWDTPGTKVTVQFRGSEESTVAASDGKWMVRIPSGGAGGPFVLKIKGSNEIDLKNILVGEVWIAGGQSNMWWHLGNCLHADAEVEDSNYPDVRIWDANTHPKQAGWAAETPQKTVKAEWKVSSPAVARDFPGTPFFFARELHKKLGVPVGIVHVAVPGMDIELFLDEPYLKRNLPQAMELFERRGRLYAEDKVKYNASLKEWQARAAEAKKENKPVPLKPAALLDASVKHRPGCLYNGTVAPAVPFGARGFLWWQGENNAERWEQYRFLFPGLIDEWRQAWGLSEAPFLFCELHAWLNPQEKPVEEATWPNLRDAQHAALALPNTYEVCNMDILTPEEGLFQIHPKNKQQAAHRLFLAAMANVYGQKGIVWSGPRFESAQFAGGAAVIHFKHLGGGLAVKGGGELKGFALAGEDRLWHWAKAKITGDTVTLTSPGVSRPVAVRYAWANNPRGNLVNKAGFPAFPFRTDAWNLGLDQN